MALTKYEKLARELQALLDNLEEHFKKAAHWLNVIQFHFFEPYLIVGRPLMSKRTLAAMMRTYILGIKWLSSNSELRSLCFSLPHICSVVTPHMYTSSRVLRDCSNSSEPGIWFVPWRVRTILPSVILQDLDEAKLEALLYCASEDEMSQWIEWFEPEDISNTVTNQLFAIGYHYEMKSQEAKEWEIFVTNTKEPAYGHFKSLVLQYCKDNVCFKVAKTLLQNEFSPQKESSVGESYELVSTSYTRGNRKYFSDFLRKWIRILKNLMFKDLHWNPKQKKENLAAFFSKRTFAAKEKKDARWKTGLIIDRQTYASFIQYFIHQFLQDPKHRKAEGEIVLLLWLMIYCGRSFDSQCLVTQLFRFTTADIEDDTIIFGNESVKISRGLANLFTNFIGNPPQVRPQKLFPNLTIDKLEDYFRRASGAIFPQGSEPALPQAFTLFPHTLKHFRLRSQFRQSQLNQNFPVYHSAVTAEKIKPFIRKK